MSKKENGTTPTSSKKKKAKLPIASTNIPNQVVNKVINSGQIGGSGLPTLPPSVTLPVEEIMSFAPECLLFQQLLEFEEKLDSSINKRLIDLQESTRRTSNKNIKTLRLSIYNTYANQTSYYHLDNKSLASVSERSSWTLRVEGRLLEDNEIGNHDFPITNKTPKTSSLLVPTPTKKKFSSFFKKVFIQIGHRDTCEWDKSQTFTETDGFEIKRNGNQELDVKILMYLDHVPQKYKVLGGLSQLLNIHTDTKPRIILALWHYIKSNTLLDPDTKKITCDENLKNIFNLDELQFNQIPQLLREHLSPPDPLEFNYTLHLSGDPKDYEQAYDIQVEVDEPFNVHGNLRKDIAAFNEEINQHIQKIYLHKRKRDFMENLSKDPLGFLNDTTTNLIKDYQVSKSNTSTGFEEERHASFYYQPMTEELVKNYLSKQTTPNPTPQQISMAPSTPQTPASS
ncbi:hypothetical protein DICPUDRAFT_83174 [Dictyostelium purpureum]|uniref:DM2 domain-containing protein n=1 Tax=Dictyostelium purpureum TaxID=5786 RepID=F0ZYR8_DICPU|nr:uncharacterized protein DICPUDRAFT_83174 [Dictyostelium purpureum]EGC30910.1 hypothetical protein DICPUDRAFT_83174 [Dictyostelium purpureum]|eukprot:XP_003292560.1 hypothetical protein DICPUDRAFT_83174 [Dictyostelium purpureum]